MDFTREPTIETIIIPKEGSILALRNSKGMNSEEYFIEALEVVTYGNTTFFRSREKPKSFLLPTNDYEVFEVREKRMVLKHSPDRASRAKGREKEISSKPLKEESKPEAEETIEVPTEKKRDKRRSSRRHRSSHTKEEGAVKEMMKEKEAPKLPKPEPRDEVSEKRGKKEGGRSPGVLLPPPSSLISDTIARYREDALFKEAFYGNKGSEEEISSNSQSTDLEPDVMASSPMLSPEETRQSTLVEEDSQWNFSSDLSSSSSHDFEE